MTPELAAINLQRVPGWIAENRLWANQADACETAAREAGHLVKARRWARNAREYRAAADRMENNLIGFASIV